MLHGRGVQLFAVQISGLVVVWVLGSLRFWVRCFGTRAVISWDDVLFYLSLGLYTTEAGFVIHGIIHGGIGKHVDELSEQEVVTAFKAWYFCEIFYGLLSISVRLSIGLFLYRLGKTLPNSKWLLLACLAAVIMTSGVYTGISAGQCSPPSHYWLQFEGRGHDGECKGFGWVPKAAIAHSAVAGISDWILAAVPILILRDTTLPRRSKNTIIALTSIGAAMAGIVMMVRILYIKMLEITTEFLSDTVDLATLSILEATLIMLAACTPALRPLYALVASRFSELRNRKRNLSGTTATANSDESASVGIVDGKIRVVERFDLTDSSNNDEFSPEYDYHKILKEMT